MINALTSAATVGNRPEEALALTNGANSGILGPGQQRWFRFASNETDTVGSVERSVTLSFTPNQQLQDVSLQLFEASQVSSFTQGKITELRNFGAGQAMSVDNTPQTSELFWTGWVLEQNGDYIQLINHGDKAIDYELVTDGVSLSTSPDNSSILESMVSSPSAGTTPETAFLLQPGQTEGHISPNEIIWYSFSSPNLTSNHFEEVSLTLVTTPNQSHQINDVAFDIFTSQALQTWSPDNNSSINNVGAGMLVPQGGGFGERFWTGWIVDNDIYYLRLHNQSTTPIDYWFFTDENYRPKW
ncbi:MAG: hypothetical protein AAF485_25275 [Chloroflexota bacterium]